MTITNVDQLLIDQAQSAYDELESRESFDELDTCYLRLRSFITIVTMPNADCSPETIAFMEEIDRKAQSLWLDRGASPSSSLN